MFPGRDPPGSSAGPQPPRRRCRSRSGRRRRPGSARAGAGSGSCTRRSGVAGSPARATPRRRAPAECGRRCRWRGPGCRTRPVRPEVGGEPAVVGDHSVHPGLQPHRQLHGHGVLLEEVRDLVLAREVPRVAGEVHARQPVEPRRRVELQRVVVAAPVVADPAVAVDDQHLPPAPGQVVAGGQTRLAGADDQGLDVLGCHGLFSFELSAGDEVQAEDRDPQPVGGDERPLHQAGVRGVTAVGGDQPAVLTRPTTAVARV